MITLTADECRALGTLVEKAMTTPGQYPLSLNALVVGISQKSNRDPVIEIDEDAALRAVDGLCAKGLARNVHVAGSRVEKYRHVAGEALGLRPPELAILAELLLRGPQTVGELRGRASRMHPLGSLEETEEILRGLAAAPPDGPEANAAADRRKRLVRELPPLPGSRAARWLQLLCEDLHPLRDERAGPAGSAGGQAGAGSPRAHGDEVARLVALEARVTEIERLVAELRAALGR